MKPPVALAWLTLAAGLFSGALYASPYIALFLLQRAVNEKDASSILSYVDVPSVREGIRQQIGEYVEYTSKADGFNTAWTGLMRGVGGALTESVLSSGLSQKGITQLLETGNLPSESKSSTDPDVLSKALARPATRYLSFDEFTVDLSSKPASPILGFNISRHNLLLWKIASVKLNLSSHDSRSGSGDSKQACGKAIVSVENRLTGYYRFPLADQKKRGLDSPYSERSNEYFWGLGGVDGYFDYRSAGSKRLDEFLGDSSTLSELSSQIIEACPDIGAVSFARSGGGYSVAWYYSPNGVFQGECVEPSREDPARNLKWGQHYCT